MSISKLSATFVLTFALIVVASLFSGFAEACDVIREGTVRLHIVANSDSDEDQTLKLALRDELLATYSPYLAALNPGEAGRSAAELCDAMQQTAQSFLIEAGYPYPVDVSLVDMYFDTTHYEDFTMPAGHYTALRFEVGDAVGKNWWCVMYPPLCIPAVSDTQADAITERIASINEPVVYKPAFAVVEVTEKIKEFFRSDS